MVEAAGIEPASERPSPTTSTRLVSVCFRLHPSPETGEYKRLSLSPHWSLKAREKRPASLIGSSTLPAQTVPEGDGDAIRLLSVSSFERNVIVCVYVF